MLERIDHDPTGEEDDIYSDDNRSELSNPEDFSNSGMQEKKRYLNERLLDRQIKSYSRKTKH